MLFEKWAVARTLVIALSIDNEQLIVGLFL